MRYMFLIYTDEAMVGEPDPEAFAAHVRFTRDAIAAGAYVTCDALQPSATATTVRVREGKTVVSDGPFAETREVLGGYYVLECSDLDEAIERAARIPPARHGSIEVRPIAEIAGWDEAIGHPRAGAAAR